jgi:hypothetical protein
MAGTQGKNLGMARPGFHWSIKYAASFGGGILSAFAATIVPSLWQLAAVAFAVILLGYSAVGAFWHLLRTRKSSPDLEKFSGVDPISLTMASFLMTDQVPETKIDGNPDALIMFERLVHAITQGEILQYGWTNRAFAQISYNATSGNTGMPMNNVPKINGKSRIPRSELIGFARARGLSPIFLQARIGAESVLATNLLAPTLTARETKEQVGERNERKEAIRQARSLIAEATGSIAPLPEFGAMLQSSYCFYKLRPYFSERFREMLEPNPRVLAVDGTHSPVPGLARALADEVDRIEREWGLA